MSSLSVVSEVCSASAFLGMLSLIGYWLTARQFRKKERSIRAVVEGDGIFDTDRAVDILGEFRGESEKLKALRVLANHDLQKAQHLLQKVKSRVDLTRFNAHALRARLLTLKISAVACLAISVIGFIYSVATPQGSHRPESGNENGGSTANINAPPIPIIINNNITPSQAVESLQATRQQPARKLNAADATRPPATAQESASTAATADDHSSTPPRPAPRRAPSISTRCQSLLQRSSLGDNLSPDEQTELRNCM